MRRVLFRYQTLSTTDLSLVACAAIVLLLCSLPASAWAERWEGKEITKDGLLHVMNPGNPIEAPATVELEKLWEIGGDDEEEYLFGVLSQIVSDERGNIYLLDSQLIHVLIFSSSGEYIRTIGRQGEGPGEFNRPSDLFVTAGGNVAVMQGMPGKIVLLTPEGDPMGNYPVPEPEDGGMRMFLGGRLAGEYVVLATQRLSRREGGIEIFFSLIGVDETGNQTATFFTENISRDFANLVFDEKQGPGSLVWNTGADGRVYASNDFDAYRIKVWHPNGTPDRVIETEYESRARSSEEMERYKPRAILRRGGRRMQPEVRTSKTDRDIQQIYPREDGGVWILSSKGAFDVPNGALATFDVYDQEGRFQRRVTLQGEGTYRDDGLHIVRDRLYVVKGLRSARRAMLGLGESESESDDADEEPMSVVCYDLSPVFHSKK